MQATSTVHLAALVLVPMVLVLGTSLWVHSSSQWESAQSPRYVRQPPLGHTGGFGEPTCHACHFGAGVNAGGGHVVLTGLPDSVEPGRVYRLTVALTDTMERAGFMMSARHADGRQAGRLTPSDSSRVTVRSAGDQSVQYAHHTVAGTDLVGPNQGTWTVRWTAPSSPSDSVLVHVAANAANDDASAFGDDIYTAAEGAVIEQEGPRR